jgi:hypothetical protein
MTFAKCSECGESFELDASQRDLEYPLCTLCWSLLEDSVQENKARVDALLDELADPDSEPSASLDLLDVPTPQGLWLKQTSYSREDHDQAMRNRNRR